MTDPTLNLERARARAQLNLERRPTAALPTTTRIVTSRIGMPAEVASVRIS